MRAFWTVVHRWMGLITAAFLFVTGLTGVVISWDHELDEWLNPHLNRARAQGTPIPALELARQVEARHPEVRVTYMPLAAEEGHTLAFSVSPRVNPATGTLFEPGYNQVFVDPVSGEELGRREWGAVWPVTRETAVSFLYKMHYTLHLPVMFGTDRWGPWLLGVIALIWTFDCFVGFYLTLPLRKRKPAAEPVAEGEKPQASGRGFWQLWKPAWKVNWSAGRYRLNFDLHRAFGLWTWVLLFILAFTAFSMNLYREVFIPVMSVVSKLTPSPFDTRALAALPMEPRTSYAEAIAVAEREARRRGWEEPVGYLFHSEYQGIYAIAFFRPEDDHGSGGVGHRQLYLDTQDASLLGDRQPWKGTAADVFVQAQFPLHSGRILGLPGRILISLMGLVVAMLSVTGVIIWWKKRTGRVRSAARSPAREEGLPAGATVARAQESAQ
ncbi:PepSY domain-containing protein [Pyxidicoccus parkwayensis]|uniref:PepSY domain-containing protein n=1 Tax=Pyxidicoccus parkwayensis TaxID=2813578 RepID=A0ABX7NLF9_9BACT|nr:PepSY-associated TM helix domain-containing protein [Pyxidicoccus parkwaysis]QSQ19458.1 PepSY domain-containing protein [Pyxidicoccus parkwaysis]